MTEKSAGQLGDGEREGRKKKGKEKEGEREKKRKGEGGGGGGEGKRRKGPEEIAFGRRNGSVTINRTAPFLRKKKKRKRKEKIDESPNDDVAFSDMRDANDIVICICI
jgi:hypothetical protein